MSPDAGGTVVVLSEPPGPLLDDAVGVPDEELAGVLLLPLPPLAAGLPPPFGVAALGGVAPPPPLGAAFPLVVEPAPGCCVDIPVVA